MTRQSIESLKIIKLNIHSLQTLASEVLDELIHAIFELIILFNLLHGLMVKYSTHLHPNKLIMKHNIISNSEIESEE